MQRQTLNIGLTVAALALGLAVWLSQKKEDKGPPLTAITAATLDHIRIEHPGAATIQLERRDGHWRITAPVQAEADAIEINAFTDLAKLEVKSALAPDQVSLKELGLQPPAYSVTLNDQKIEFGGQEPIQARRYLLVNGKVDLVDDPPAEPLDANYSDLASRALLPAGAQIRAIRLPGLDIARAADDKSWALTPENADIGSDARQKLIDAWSNARAMWNAALPQDGAKGDDVDISLKDGSHIRLVVTARDPQFVIARPDLGLSYTLSRQLVEQMLKLQDGGDTAAAKTAK